MLFTDSLVLFCRAAPNQSTRPAMVSQIIPPHTRGFAEVQRFLLAQSPARWGPSEPHLMLQQNKQLPPGRSHRERAEGTLSLLSLSLLWM